MKNKELTRDEMIILLDVLDTILDERETRKVFNQIHGTTTQQLDKISSSINSMSSYLTRQFDALSNSQSSN